jgi:hypothetical protein
LVWGFDLVGGEWKLSKVIKTFPHDYEGSLVSLTVEGEVIEATGNHPFWVIAGEGLEQRERADHVPVTPLDARLTGRWIDARSLGVRDTVLLKPERRSTISGLSVRRVRQKVYNFQVEEVHTYAVGAIQLLVHNKPPEPVPGEGGPPGPGQPGPAPEEAARIRARIKEIDDAIETANAKTKQKLRAERKELKAQLGEGSAADHPRC